MSSLQDVPLTTIAGEPTSLSAYSGRALLIVNVASKCGFTPQYTGLEALFRRYKDRGLQVLGFPCDQFGHQEPGDEAQIRNFCSTNYDVSFPMFSKIEVNGPGTHPLYQELKKAAPGIFGTERIKWNFTKFLVDPRGQVVARFAPTAKPQSLSGAIEAVLPS